MEQRQLKCLLDTKSGSVKMRKTGDEAKNKPMTADVEFDGDLVTVNKPSHNVQLQFMNACGNAVSVDAQGIVVGQDFEAMFESSRDFIFACCPFLDNKEMRDELNIKGEPMDIVSEIFGVEGTIEFAMSIKEAFDIEGETEKVVAEIKN